MKIYDITVPISPEMPTYPGDPTVEVKPVSQISEGTGANVSVLSLGSHTGTHIDPPYHFVEWGLTVEQIPLDVLIGDCFVLDLGDVPVIGTSDLETARIPAGTKRLLFKTRNSFLWKDSSFRQDFTYLNVDAANWLVDQGVELVGIDYLSIDQFQSPTHSTHHRLLESGIIVVEGLDLGAVAQGIYTLVCLPLKITGGDGAPARTVLLSKD